jgi:RNA polymerase sigma-70 factor (ECF subfamily)
MGDEDELFRRFAPRVRAFGLRHLGDAAAADDLVQQVLVVVIESRRAGKLREPEQLASFVLGTARMIARGLRSGEWRRRQLLDRWHVPDAPVEPSAALDLERLRGCLEGLPPKERQVVVMSFYGGEDGDAIAGALGISDGNVRVIRHRAVARLQDCMGIE